MAGNGMRRQIYGREELYERTQWRQVCSQYPDHEIIVVVDSAHMEFDFACLIAVPCQNIRRLKSEGYIPFFRHGQVMHIRPQAAA